MPGFAQPGPGEDPDLTETAVLPHTEGPPLVRPYVPSVPVEDQPDPYAPAPGDPYATAPADPYATAVLPAAPYPPAPADPYATAVLPPVGHQGTVPHTVPPPPQPAPQAPPPSTRPAPWALPPELPPRELGLFPIADGQDAARGRTAARQAGRPRRRTGLIAAAGVGVVALGVGLAYVLSPGSSSTDQALPVMPTGAASPSSGPTTGAAPSSAPVTAPPSTAAAPASSARPTAPRTKAAPRTTPPPTPSTSAAAPPPPPPTQAPPTSAAPTSAAPSRTAALPAPGDSGPAVVALQRQLRAAGCGGTHSGKYDIHTEGEVAQFQDANNIDANQQGALDQQTQDALDAGDTC
ncbi:peptidoglycan-binding protein [Kitasatospora sp. RB6PN24]|uniref:peptidoglycan-binding protein n=1 Tax=Kitasatospora humi TaxID=2893891 RepID=UPI001E55A0D7|nr:peptidoglycan-binding protein [Kitasatospora humi]MCC9311047.1 peptidoglycan-binding protein [Kitasatospora humi]